MTVSLGGENALWAPSQCPSMAQGWHLSTLWRGSVGVKGCSHVGPEFEPAQQSVIWGHLRSGFYQQFLLKWKESLSQFLSSTWHL